MEMKFPSEFTLQLWVFLWWGWCEHKYCASVGEKSLGNDRNLDL